MNKNEFVVVKPLFVARRIAAALRRNGNPEAASAYLRGFELREGIERVAQAVFNGTEVTG